jgi:hypothetical protein
MKYLIPESRLESLQQLARKRHANKEPKGHKSGSFDFQGKEVTYDLFDKQTSIYSNTKVGSKRFNIFIMNELDFLPLTDEEQKKISEYRIKKYLEKKLSIKESILPKWVKRRMDELEFHINDVVKDYPMLCEDFEDEFEYADNVISRAVDDFLAKDEDLMNSLGDDYDDIHSYLIDYCKEVFGEYLLEDYVSTCQEEDENEEEDINESENNSTSDKKIVKNIERIVSTLSNEYVCKVTVDPEPDDDRYWVMIWFNQEFMELEPYQRMTIRIEIANEVERMVKDYMSIDIYIGTAVNLGC